jgi:hypothetical protein
MLALGQAAGHGKLKPTARDHTAASSRSYERWKASLVTLAWEPAWGLPRARVIGHRADSSDVLPIVPMRNPHLNALSFFIHSAMTPQRLF